MGFQVEGSRRHLGICILNSSKKALVIGNYLWGKNCKSDSSSLTVDETASGEREREKNKDSEGWSNWSGIQRCKMSLRVVISLRSPLISSLNSRQSLKGFPKYGWLNLRNRKHTRVYTTWK